MSDLARCACGAPLRILVGKRVVVVWCTEPKRGRRCFQEMRAVLAEPAPKVVGGHWSHISESVRKLLNDLFPEDR